MRTLVDIPEGDIDRLDALAAAQKRSRTALVRDAVRAYLAQQSGDVDWIERGFGFWRDRPGAGD